MKRIFRSQKKLLLLVIILAGVLTEVQAQVVVRRPAGVTVVRRPVAPGYYVPARRVVVAPRAVVVAPLYRPGVLIAALPAYYTVTYFGSVPYYYSSGVYYIKVEGSESYKVVLPPKGTIVPSLPDGAEKTQIDGITYFEYQGVLYKEVIIDQAVKYEVVGYTNPTEKK